MQTKNKKPLKWWLKERCNPQLKKPYYTKLGQLADRAAYKHVKSIYGENYVHSYETEEAYQSAIEALLMGGYRVTN